MYRSILVPLDGSALCEQALPVAQTIARRSSAHVTLAYVRPPAEVHAATDSLAGNLDEVVETDQSITKLYMQKLARRFANDKQLTVTTHMLVGTIVEAISSYVTNNDIDLIVMTAHEHGVRSRLWLGIVADSLMRHVTVPVLLVRAHLPTALQPGDRLFGHILIPLDGSALAESVLESAIAFGELYSSHFTLLQAIQPAPFLYASPPLASAIEKDFLEEQRTAAYTYLEGIAERFRIRSLSVESAVFFDSPAHAITTLADRSAVDLIAMATHGRGGFKRLLLGSVANKVVRSANTSILLTHPHPEQQLSKADLSAKNDAVFEMNTRED